MATSFVIWAIVVIALHVWFLSIGLWISARSAGVPLEIGQLIGMRLRRVRPEKIVRPLIRITQANIPVLIQQLEMHYLAGGRVDIVVNAMIAANRAGLELPFERAAATDLAGSDIFEAVDIHGNLVVVSIEE
jgi:uncharacterized protein YqfA (UPF0365 family)